MDYLEILAKTTEVAQGAVREETPACDRDGRWHEQGMRAMQSAGLAGLVVGKEHGGLGHGLKSLAEVCERLGQESASMGLCFGMHCVGSAVISAKATPGQSRRYLKPICHGEHITTLTLSEPGTGAHFYYPQTTLTADGPDSFLVDGKKTFSTNGGHADSYVISTVADELDAPIGHFSCVLIDKDMPGVEWKGEWNGIGMRGNSSRSVDLSAVRVPQDNLLGQEGDQIWYIFNVVAPYFLMAMAGTYLGVAQAAFDQAREHMLRRVHTHSGSNLASIQLLQHRLGGLWTKLQRTRQLIYWAADDADSGGESAVVALCAAKADVASCAVQLVNEAMTLCGGMGYREGGPLERMLRDVRAADVMSPTTDLLLTWAGRALLDQPLLD